MQFELTEALVDAILFAMEDQNRMFRLDTRNGLVIPEGDAEPGGDLDDEDDPRIPLPEWDSSEGFRLMERFTAGFKNTIIRNKLTAALDKGRGVFRAFKDVMAEYPEAEQRWFAFKNREMRKVIMDWYNGLREEWGLKRLGAEPEETRDLVLEDFCFRDAVPEDQEAAQALHREYITELREILAQNKVPEKAVRSFVAERTRDWIFPGDQAVIAETGAGEFAGCLTAEIRGDALRVTALEVRPEYRSLGIGEALLSRLPVSSGEITRVILDLPAESDDFSRVLLRHAFTPYTTGYVRYLQRTENASPSDSESTEESMRQALPGEPKSLP
ncbi:MAG: GNAT family N-acetyltransferase [Spirochaetaceae bacterium]|jgi:GNAT superfamily N-acetyltransferase|nr:GNAT family N-acetyltransferase [Spirochaetaceae bacterium]